jgi:hypothetical protein
MATYIVYKITNKLDGKFYIGTHKTDNLDDGYMGSGKYLNYAIKKHGEENFSKEILFTFDNAEAMFAKEAEIVNEDFLATENTYNLRVGGFGGFDYVNSQRDLVVKRNRKIAAQRDYKDPEYIKKVPMLQKGFMVGVARNPGNKSFTGRKHSEETKKKMSIARKAQGNFR